MRETELAAVPVVVEEAALHGRKGSLVEKSRECGRLVAPCIKKAFGLRMCVNAAYLVLGRV